MLARLIPPRFILSVAAFGAALLVPYAGASQARQLQSRATCVVAISQLAFQPSSVTEGEKTTLKIRVTNCGAQLQQVTLTQFGSQPPGCAVLDPISWSARIPGHTTYSHSEPFVAPSCTGRERITLRVTSASGQTLAHRTASFTVRHP
jgi:hypothetical protein